MFSKNYFKLEHIKYLVKSIFFYYKLIPKKTNDKEEVLKVLFAWVKNGFYNNDDGGIPTWYWLRRGWCGSYPEVSGYLVPSLIDYYKWSNDASAIDIARKILDWELEIQTADGGIPGESIDKNKPPVIFNTAQVIDGWVSGYEFFKDEKYLKAARKSGDWIIKNQNTLGYFDKFCPFNIKGAFETRTAYPILRLYKMTGENKYAVSMKKLLDWILTLQEENGWFNNCDLSVELFDRPFLHGISYTIEGFIKCGLILNNERFVKAGEKAVHSLLKTYEQENKIFARYDRDWNKVINALLPVGMAQFANILLLLYNHRSYDRYFKVAKELINELCKIIDLNSKNKGIRGGVPGSWPIWSKYCNMRFISWGNKFLMDAIISCIQMN